MKKTILFFILLLCIQGFFAEKSQAQTDKKNIIKVNLFSPIVRTASIFYEREVSETVSAQLGFFYTGASIDDTEFRGFGITPEVRFYLSDKGTPEGFFIAPFVRYQNFNLTIEDADLQIDSEADLTGIGGGLLIGGQWVFKDVVSLDVWGGPSYSSVSIDVTSGDEDDFSLGSVDGFGVRFGVTLGFAF